MLQRIALIHFLLWYSFSSAQVFSSGSDHSILVCKNGMTYTSGDNSFGQLGNDTSLVEYVYKKVAGVQNIVQVEAGDRCSFALGNNGDIWVWGNNASGQLGTGNVSSQPFPQKLTRFAHVVQVSAGPSHTLCLDSNGTVWGAGSNLMGELSKVPPPYNSLQFNEATSLGICHELATGHNFSLVLKKDSSVWGFGTNGVGELGRGTTNASPHAPAQVSNLSEVISIAAGGGSSFAVQKNGDVWAWGSNSHGQIGNGLPMGSGHYTATPMKVVGVDSIKALSSNGVSVLALRYDGTVWAWGYNAGGQLGNGTTTSTNVPFKVLGLIDIVEINSGVVSIAVDKNGNVFTWGTSFEGALASDTITQKLTPSPITPIACNPIVSVPEVKVKEQAIEVFPNPTNGRLFLESSGAIENIEVFNSTGLSVKIKDYSDSSIDISDLPQGIYFLRLEIDKKTVTKKVIKRW